MDLAWLSPVLTALTVIGVLATGFVKIRSAVDDTTAELWKGEAEAQKARGDRLEVQLFELTKRVESLESENRLLKDMVTGSAAIAELGTLIAANHAELVRLWESSENR